MPSGCGRTPALPGPPAGPQHRSAILAPSLSLCIQDQGRPSCTSIQQTSRSRGSGTAPALLSCVPGATARARVHEAPRRPCARSCCPDSTGTEVCARGGVLGLQRLLLAGGQEAATAGGFGSPTHSGDILATPPSEASLGLLSTNPRVGLCKEECG